MVISPEQEIEFLSELRDKKINSRSLLYKKETETICEYIKLGFIEEVQGKVLKSFNLTEKGRGRLEALENSFKPAPKTSSGVEVDREVLFDKHLREAAETVLANYGKYCDHKTTILALLEQGGFVENISIPSNEELLSKVLDFNFAKLKQKTDGLKSILDYLKEHQKFTHILAHLCLNKGDDFNFLLKAFNSNLNINISDSQLKQMVFTSII